MTTKKITILDVLKQIKCVDTENSEGIAGAEDAIVLQWMVGREMLPDSLFTLLSNCEGDIDKAVLYLNLASEIEI